VTMKILIVDDDQDHAESIGDLLDLRGYDIELAASGEQAAARFRDQKFDFVLMDVKLPGMNGVETFLEFKKIRSDAKVLMMTGYSVDQLIARAVDNGALGVLHKPFAISHLLQTLESVKPRGLVLVADDDPDFAASIEPILTQNGYVVEIARNGEEALAKASSGSITCLILDLKLPFLSGLEVYLKLKDAAISVPTIFVTGYADSEMETLARAGQFAPDLLIKPFAPQALLKLLADAMPQGPPTHAE
jgi:two-component system response regulator HydG